MESVAPACKTKLRIDIEADPIATLENALAIIRRLGMELRSLHVKNGSRGATVRLHLSAEDEDEIEICCKRLRNVIGINGVHEYRRPNERYPSIVPRRSP